MECHCGAHCLFDLGQIAISPEAAELLAQMGIQLIEPLWLHATGQWPQADAAHNEIILREGRSVVVSRFQLDDGWELVIGTGTDHTGTLVDVRRSWE